MNTKSKAALIALSGIVLLAVGVLVVFFVLQRINTNLIPQPSPAERADQNKVNVVVTNRDVFLGELIGPMDVTTISMPAEFVPRNFVDKAEDAINKFVKTDLVQGEMLLKHNLADPTNINHDLAYILSDNHVLFAFPANDLMSVNNVIQRGDIVDILATIRVEVDKIGPVEGEPGTALAPTSEEEDEAETRVFSIDAHQAVEITALVADIVEEEQVVQLDTSAPPARQQMNVMSYLLALPPQDALILKHLIDTGGIFDMVLRAPTSRGKFDLTPVTKEYIVELYGLGIVP